MAVIRLFLVIPFAALTTAVPLTRGWGLSWLNVTLAAVFCTVSTLGVTIGYHRYFTHGAFKAKHGLRVALAIAGGLAAQDPVIGLVARPSQHSTRRSA